MAREQAGGQAPENRATADIGPLGEPALADYLTVLRAELGDTIRPAIADERTRKLLDMSLTLLDHLIVRAGKNGPALAARAAGLADLEQALGGGDMEAAVAQAIHGRDIAGIAAIRAGLASEARFLEGIGALEAADRHIALASEARPFDAAGISDYLTRRYGGPVLVREIGSPIGGYSKDVCVLHLDGELRPADRIVIRRDLPNGPLEGSVSEEFRTLEAVHAAGIPVARPLWLESDPAIFGGVTICLAFVEGAPITDPRGNILASKGELAFRHLARIMGRLHGMDPSAAGLLPEGAARDAAPHILRLLADFEAQWLRRREAGNMVLAASFAWMRARLPAGPYPAAIVHGDCSLRNLMLSDDQPTALLDWETCHLGDPAEDLAYVRDEVELFLSWDSFMAEYRAAGGPEIGEERLRYWSIWRELRGAITSISMMDAVPKHSADLRAAFGGLYFTRVLLTKLATRLQDLLDA